MSRFLLSFRRQGNVTPSEPSVSDLVSLGIL